MKIAIPLALPTKNDHCCCECSQETLVRSQRHQLHINAPLPSNSEGDSSCATLVPLTPDTEYVTSIGPINANQDHIHHIVVQICHDVPSTNALEKYVRGPGKYNGCDGEVYEIVSDACINGQVIFTWARNSPRLQLPDDVSLPVGQSVSIPYILLQTQYYAGAQADENSLPGVVIELQRNPTAKFAAVLLIGSSGSSGIQAHAPSINLVSSCRYSGNKPIQPFAFRVHAHKLSRFIAGFVDRNKSGQRNNLGFSKPKLFARGDPWLPQLFYPIPTDETVVINPGDVLGAVCNYNAASRQHLTYVGTSSASDEMCNMQILYSYDANSFPESGERIIRQCFDDNLTYTYKLPALPSNPSLSESDQQVLINSVYGSAANITVDDVLGDANMMARRHPVRQKKLRSSSPIEHVFDSINMFVAQKKRAKKHALQNITNEFSARSMQMPNSTSSADPLSVPSAHNTDYELVQHWFNYSQLPGGFTNIGQIAGLSYNPQNNRLFVFRRASHTWDGNTFDPFTNIYLQVNKGPIAEPTVLEIDVTTGRIVEQWGQQLFYMPHSVTVDAGENIWLTDVALHQVWKFDRNNRTVPSLVLGERFEPGNDEFHFCKPTDVAVMPNGDFFVSDGYCNARVVKFSAVGNYIDQIGYILPSWSPTPFDFLSSQRVDWNPGPAEFSIPHCLTLDQNAQHVFVADRENGRIQVFRTQGAMAFVKSIQIEPFVRSAVYAVDYRNGTLVGVNGRLALGGAKQQPVAIVGALIDPGLAASDSEANIVGQFGYGVLRSPHAVAIGADLRDIFVGEIGPNRLLHFRRKQQ